MTNMDEVRTDDQNDEYYENEYPYVCPDHSIIDMAENPRFLEGLTSVEQAFIKWFIELGVSEEAFKRIKHPAFPFGTNEITSRTLFNRPQVKQAIKAIKKGYPFLSVYNADYLIGVLHEEIQHFRVANRHHRFNLEAGDVGLFNFAGKKSLHEEEMLEAKLLVDCIKQVQELAGLTKDNGSNNGTSASSGGENSSLNRVLADTEKLIEQCQGNAVNQSEAITQP